MPEQIRIVSAGPSPRSVRTVAGEVLHPPADWTLVPPGDAALTRRIRVAGPTWSIQEKKGRKVFSLGVWAPAAAVKAIQGELVVERATPQYARKQQTQARRRDLQQVTYVHDFQQAVLDFLAFPACYAALAQRLAQAITEHATPIGSGTVARTQRIALPQRVEAAVIAWMRHRTTAYDHMSIARVKGKRREIRRALAQQSKALLEGYRRGHGINPMNCPLQRALVLNPAPTVPVPDQSLQP